MIIKMDTVEAEIASIFRDNEMTHGVGRELLTIRFLRPPTTEQLEKLTSGSIVFFNDEGVACESFTGFNTIQDCSVILTKESEAEAEINALKAELAALKSAHATLRAAVTVPDNVKD